MGLDTRLRDVVGGRTARQLADHLGLVTVADVLHHYPRRYYRRGELTDLATLRPDEYATVMARVVGARQVKYTPKHTTRPAVRTELKVTDGRAELRLVFFQRPWLTARLRPGTVALFSGKVRRFRTQLELVHPDYHLLGGDGDADTVDMWVRDLLPVYPATAAVTTAAIARAVELVLLALDPVPDPVPDDVRRRNDLVGLDRALRDIHQPREHAGVDTARRRLAYEEAFVLQAALAQRRRRSDSLSATARPGAAAGILAHFDESLPYQLTRGQRDVGDQIAADLARPRPMHRLLQGDVGTGKTLVALRAILQVVDSGGQAVLLAPTEVLAQQHHANIRTLLGDLAEAGTLGSSEHATGLTLLTRSTTAAARRAALFDIATGAAGIVVGTQALLQPSVSYHDLGLIVVDEQHRFGVEQRSALLDRIQGQRPHLLVMTATPIPRTVAMTVFGDLHVSTLVDRPLGQPDVKTHVVSEPEQPAHVARAWGRVAEEVRAGRQVFVVCTRIEDSDPGTSLVDATAGEQPELLGLGDAPDPHSVTALAAELARGPLAGLRLGVMHGRMSAEDKDNAMRRFVLGPAHPDGLDVLVSTTVVEVGVDVPAASMMVVMDADRFGVSQLHQLRGRIGRAGQPALCLLMTQATTSDASYDRLRAIAATNDGFALAQLDLEQRREGDVLGAAQSGTKSSLKLLSVLRDEDLIVMARDDAGAVVASDPDLEAHHSLRAAVRALEEAERAEYLEKA